MKKKKSKKIETAPEIHDMMQYGQNPLVGELAARVALTIRQMRAAFECKICGHKPLNLLDVKGLGDRN